MAQQIPEHAKPVFEPRRFRPLTPIVQKSADGKTVENYTPEVYADRDVRVELQIRELKREYGKAGLKRRRGELELYEENFKIIEPVRQAVERSIDLNVWKNDPSGEIAKVEAALAEIQREEAGDQPLKTQYIAADTRYWQERLQETFRTEDPKNPLRFLTWLLSQKGYRRTEAWKNLLQGVARMRQSQKRLDESEKQRREITGENDEYRTDLRELSLVWEMLRKLYGDTKTHEGHLRRTPQSFFGMRVAGGAALHSPKIHLQTSYSGEEIATHLNDLVAPGTLTMGAGMIHAPAIQLQFAEGQLVHQKEEPYLSESQRKMLLELVRAEEKSWEEKKRDVVVQNIHGDRILASWRLMRQYVEFLIQRIEAREKIKGRTSAELMALLEDLNRKIAEQKKVLNGADFVDAMMGKPSERGGTGLDLAMIRQFRAFMELLGGSPLVKGICNFALQESVMVGAPGGFSILEHGDYDYRWHYVDGDEIHTLGKEERVVRLNEKWDRGGDFVEWKDRRKYPAENIRGETIEFDGLDSSGEKINPKVFHRGTLFEKVVLRVFAELARHDPPSFSCAMLWGTEEQGNLLYQSFASALARKMWEMEKKWGSMSDQTRRQWLGSRGDIEHFAPGRLVNTIRLAAFDYWSS